MDFELWWLLPIPALFFAMGWIAARIDIKHLLRESRALPLSYFRGLNFLLNEQPDKAIESFIEKWSRSTRRPSTPRTLRWGICFAAKGDRSRDSHASESARSP
jgi:lipopolysaccharide biosynthesis regulator YciM